LLPVFVVIPAILIGKLKKILTGSREKKIQPPGRLRSRRPEFALKTTPKQIRKHLHLAKDPAQVPEKKDKKILLNPLTGAPICCIIYT